ncbi:MAG: DUF3987 domain-containing protein [Desulfobacteraceae bacterium]|nr:DUF3987 domain-containing protein [Desulfobacteraceae bacterium]
MNLTIDKGESKRFFDLLWPSADEGLLCISSKGSNGMVSKFFSVPVKETACNAIERWSGRDIWYSISLFKQRPEKGRGTEADVIAIPAFWADIDCKEGSHKETSLPSKDEALSFLRELPFKPSLIVWSGGGLHVYWIFKEPWIFDNEAERQQAKELSSRFQLTILNKAKVHGWALDNTADLVRLLRVPGTHNFKRDPVEVKILELNNFRYEPDSFEDFLIDEQSPQQPPQSPDIGSGGLSEIIKQCHFLHHCKSNAASLPEPSWWSMVCSLCFEGGSKSVIHDLSRDYPGYDQKETDQKILEALKQTGPMTCKVIREKTGFECPPGGCGVMCPVHLGKKNQHSENKHYAEQQQQIMDTAKKLFPRGPFPWDVLPSSIAESLKQLARSCASSETSLPGAAIAIFASLIGDVVSVSPKLSWQEPLIFWFSDIRPSGTGKTPAARSLCQVLYDAQKEADEEYKQGMGEWDSLPRKDKGKPPDRPRGYFVTDLTLEGLRSDHSGHGGKVCVLDELSSFLSAQNQYKAKKGSDRESWLALYDGKPARIVRAKESITLSGSRISIFGGVQPGVWRKTFSGEDGEIYLIDGTIFRFLPTYEGSAFYPLTAESWSDENCGAWEHLLRTVMSWSDSQQEAENRKVLCLSEDAQEIFFEWRNGLMQVKDDLPGQVRGFIPKLVGAALRFAGVLYLMDVFSRGEAPGSILQIDDITKGTRLSVFYLGHIIQAMEALTSKDIPEVFEVTGQMIHLAKTLEVMKPELDSGRLAIGYIQERFNEKCDKGLKVRSPHLMGSMLRKYDLTITGGRYQANGRSGVYCLVWDEKTNSFIESCPNSPSSPQMKKHSGSPVMDNSNPKSKKSIDGDNGDGEDWTTWTTNGQSPEPESLDNSGFMDNLDNLDNFSNENEKEEAPEFVEL